MNAKPHKMKQAKRNPAPGPEASPRFSSLSPWARLWAPAALGVLVALFLALRAHALLPHPADEGIYFYGALRWGQGQWPYRDFFHAHPPLHLLPNALLFRAFGFSLLLAKAHTFMAAAFCGVAAFLVVQKLSAPHSRFARQLAGLLAAAALLFAESTLKAAATDTGILQACGWVALSTVLLVYGRPVAAGAAAAAAPLTLIQAGPAALVVLTASIFWGRRFALRMIASTSAVFVAIHIVMSLVAGAAFWQQVYGFHLEKVGTPGEGARQLGFVIFDNWMLFALAVCGAVGLLWNSRKTRTLAALAGLAVIVTIWAMATRPRVFPFYFQPAFFPLALLVGWGGAQVFDAALVWWRQQTSPRPLHAKQLWAPVVLAVLLLGPLQAPLAGYISPLRAQQLASYTQTYQWTDAPGLGPLNEVLQAAFWQQGTRVAGRDANAVTQYLWQRSRWLDAHPNIVAAVTEQARTQPSTSLFGDSTLAPLVAMQAGVPIAGDLVDTNMQRLKTGNITLAAIFSVLDQEPNALLLLGTTGGIGSLPEMRAYAMRHYETLGQFSSRTGPACTLWRRRSQTPP